jgi:hypothetical protein
MQRIVNKLFKIDHNSMVVRKTDDELTRYVKQTKRTEKRKVLEKSL